MPEINPLTNNQIFLKKIAENTGSNYETGDVSEINPLTIDQILLKEIAANTAGQSGDITELEEKVSATQDMVGDAYDSTHTYNVGDYCIYENVLYKCNTASTTGTWDSSKWNAVTVTEDLGELREKSVKVVGIALSAGENAIYDLPAIVGFPHFILIGSNNPGVWSWCGIVTYSQFGFIVYEIHKGGNISVEAVTTGIKITNNDGVYYVMLTLRQF